MTVKESRERHDERGDEGGKWTESGQKVMMQKLRRIQTRGHDPPIWKSSHGQDIRTMQKSGQIEESMGSTM